MTLFPWEYSLLFFTIGRYQVQCFLEASRSILGIILVVKALGEKSNPKPPSLEILIFNKAKTKTYTGKWTSCFYEDFCLGIGVDIGNFLGGLGAFSISSPSVIEDTLHTYKYLSDGILNLKSVVFISQFLIDCV